MSDAIPSTAKIQTSPLPFIEFFMETLYLSCVSRGRLSTANSRHKVSVLSHVPYITASRIFTRKLLFVSLFSQSDLPEKGQLKVDKIFLRFMYGMIFSLFLSTDTILFTRLCCGLTHQTLIKLRKVVIITWTQNMTQMMKSAVSWKFTFSLRSLWKIPRFLTGLIRFLNNFREMTDRFELL